MSLMKDGESSSIVGEGRKKCLQKKRLSGILTKRERGPKKQGHELKDSNVNAQGTTNKRHTPGHQREWLGGKNRCVGDQTRIKAVTYPTNVLPGGYSSTIRGRRFRDRYYAEGRGPRGDKNSPGLYKDM